MFAPVPPFQQPSFSPSANYGSRLYPLIPSTIGVPSDIPLTRPAQIPFFPGSTGFTPAMLPPSSSAGLPFHGKIPTSEDVDNKLSLWNGLAVGATSGSVIGAAMSVPIYGLERLFKSQDILTLTKHTLPKSAGSGVIQKPMLHLGITTASLLMTMTLLGGLMGMFLTSSLKNKVKAIAEANEQQQQGQQSQASNAVQRFYQQLGLLPKPVSNPQAEFAQLVNNDLDRKHAFGEGFKEILLVKLVVGGLLSLATHLGILGLIQATNFYKLSDKLSFRQKLKINNKKLLNLMMWEQVKPFLKHPMGLTKLALLPVAGGVVAMQLFPQIREKLISTPRQI